MNKPKLLLSINGGVVEVQGATADMQIYIADWDILQYCSPEDTGDSFEDEVLRDWRHPSEQVETNFEEYVKEFVERTRFKLKM